MHTLVMLIRVILTLFFFILIHHSSQAGSKLFPAESNSNGTRPLLIYSSLDTTAARPLINAFQSKFPNVSVQYYELQTLDIYDRIIQETNKNTKTADLVISSAMDLQMKLANDGYASQLDISKPLNWPDWASWRDTAFALTFEPAVMVYHKPSFKKLEVPKTRTALSKLMKKSNNELYGRIATYDIERAGLGLLFLARDIEHYRDIWSLVHIMSSTGVKLYSNSSAILERVADGRFAIGYNILGSYAQAWAEHNKDLGIILPIDYTVVMSRIALVPKAATSSELGKLFLEFLMSKTGQEVMAKKSKLPALHPDIVGKNTANDIRMKAGNHLRPIPVSPGLLVYLDQVKRSRFLKKWNEVLRKK